ncbi:MAG TPA: hypothetical protein VJ914_04880 [Pseudonocardiaceae bacterium]|nr:hypothetical protein [Pseudonocardiaceae bacterium]
MRHARQLHTAISCAKKLGCALVVLCSKKASVGDAVRLARKADIELIAIDATQLPPGLLPTFNTSRFALHDTRDTATKRNVALLFAYLIGWQRIFFLDDDITLTEDSLAGAVAALDKHHVVGLHVDQFPDNSVVCHAARTLGWAQRTFMGGGALAVHVKSSERSFFPQVYNEDWFFLLGENELRPAAIRGEAIQAKYDPFANRQRARYEEFGDTLAEGVFWLLDNGTNLTDANLKHWQRFSGDRRRFIKSLLIRSSQAEDRARTRALTAALERNNAIEVERYVGYLDAWRVDRDLWRDHLTARKSEFQNSAVQASSASAAEKVLSELGLMTQSQYLRRTGRSVRPSVVAALD